MNRTEIIDDFTNFINERKTELQKCIVKVEDLQPDDEWILDEAWDGGYLDIDRKANQHINFKKYSGRGEKMFRGNIDEYVRGMRADERGY